MPVTKRVPKDQNDLDGTLEAVLSDVKFRADNNMKLTDYSVPGQEVVLTYKPVK